MRAGTRYMLDHPVLQRLRDRWAGGDGSRPRVVKTPTLIQTDAVGCGAATLGSILGYHGLWIPVEELRQQCGVSRDGVDAGRILEVARNHGLQARGFKLEPRALTGIPWPCVLHWNFSHWVIFEGFLRDGRARINDPAEGRRILSPDELDEAMTGVVVALWPSSDFEPAGRPHRVWPAFRRLFEGATPALAVIAGISMMLAIPTLLLPTLSRLFVDRVLIAGQSEALGLVVAGLLLVSVITALLLWVRQRRLLELETDLQAHRSGRFLWHLLSLPLQKIHQRHTGDLVNRIALNGRLTDLVTRDLAVQAPAVGLLCVYATIMAGIDPWMTAITLALLGLNAGMLILIGRKRAEGHTRLLFERAKLDSASQWGLEMIESLKATASEGDLFTHWAGYQTRAINVRHAMNREQLLLQVVPPLLAGLNAAVILGLGGLRVLQNEMSLGTLLAFQLLAIAFAVPIAKLVTLGGRMQLAKGEIALVDDVLSIPSEQSSQQQQDVTETNSEPPKRLRGELELCRVDFGYDGQIEPLIRDLNIQLHPGERLALVGSTGSGKSTIARLVTGLFQPWRGEILFDGKPIHRIESNTWRRSVAVVDQDLVVFAGTLREHLTLWEADVDDTALRQAAADACILDEILARPGGFDSEIAEGGINFSGGQLQRLEIARALVGSPAVLVLDEATSALDPEVEAQIIERLRRRHMTCLIVAHRLSTVRDCDHILVLEDGKLAEQGSHNELVQRRGLYLDLIQQEAP